MANHEAPSGQVYICAACGKRSRDQRGTGRLDSGWDESCMMNSVLVYEDSLVFENGRVTAAKAVEKEQL